MGYHEDLDDSEIGNLPPEAHGNVFDTDGPFDPDNHWLRTADVEPQLIAMRAWFVARYCDPAHETPYNGREGGYLFVDGGPYDPADVLRTRFAGLVSGELIQRIVDEMHSEVGAQWAPRRQDRAEDEYDDRFDIEIEGAGEPLRKLRERREQSLRVLALTGDPEAKVLVGQLIFSAAIGALETYLFETAYFWIPRDEQALRDLIEKHPHFRDQPIKLGELFKRQHGLKDQVKGYLQNLVWHRWENVGSVFRSGLGIRLPNLRQFDEALLKRHDFVHRSGHGKDGSITTVTVEEIAALWPAIESFATQVEALVATRASGDTSGDMPDS
jgi:hypothetical protein